MRRAAAVLAVVVATLTAAPGPGPAAALTPVEPDSAWVVLTYRHLFERPPTNDALRYRTDQLHAGRSRRAMADELVASREHAGVILRRLYDRILGRVPDAASRTYWIDRLVAGERVSTVASFLYGSPELYTAAGGTAEGYVAFLYRDILGREPDAAGAAYWEGRIAGGASRIGLARAWYLTPEATGLRAGVMFLDLLHRPPSVAERSSWAERLRRIDERQVTAAIVSSSEAYRLASAADRSTRLTAGNGHSAEPSISADGRIIAFASSANDLTPAGSPPGTDVFVLDRRTGRLRALTAGNGTSHRPQVSSDGTSVVFQSAATNLVSGDDNGHVDVFQVPATGGPVSRVTDGDGDSIDPTTSGDGTVVAFSSVATDLVAGDTNGAVSDVFVLTAGPGQEPTRERIGGSGPATVPDLSADGGTIVFEADDLQVPELSDQVYVARLPLGPEPTFTRLSDQVSGQVPTVSADGNRVAFVEYEPAGGSFHSSVVVATADAGGVYHRSSVSTGSKPGSARIAGGGRHVLVSAIYGSSIAAKVFGLGVTAPAGSFPLESDLTADGWLVVGSRSGQIRLYGTP
ncbi:MAG TPA: DUF4214 domain-containing protein [Iamia sp.]|nr:DUF4214 domain-containing protein [Iamia sp.]